MSIGILGSNVSKNCAQNFPTAFIPNILDFGPDFVQRNIDQRNSQKLMDHKDDMTESDLGWTTAIRRIEAPKHIEQSSNFTLARRRSKNDNSQQKLK
jgi:hypothetical protein